MKQLTFSALILFLSSLALGVEPHGPKTPVKPTDKPVTGKPIDKPVVDKPVVGRMPDMTGAEQLSATGSIAIKAVQGTKDGPKIARAEVTVELYGHGGKFRTIETKLDAHGVVTIEDLPMVPPFRPRVFIKYGGTSYTKDGAVMDAGHAAQDMEIKVFETSDKNPQWEVAMWHLIIEPVEGGGLKVVETLAVRNMTDTAYLGAPDANGRQTAITLSLPQGVTEIEKMSGGLHECCAKMVDGRLVSKAPITPGMSQFKMEYTIPTPTGGASIDLVAPANAKQLLIFVPNGLEGFSSESLKAGDVFNVKQRAMQSYILADISAGRKISFAIEGLPRPVAAGSTIPKVLAGLGAFVLVIACVVVLLIRKPETQPEAV
jgi:hypothetical protein